MNTKFTPGPWSFVDDVILSPDPDKAIGTVFPCDRIAPGEFKYGDETAANARLFAAAPDLLAVAMYCEDVLMRYTIDRIDGDEIANAALSVIRAAIAAATGEEA